jgi:hypothetical protein
VNDAAKKADELLGQRLVEPKILADELDRFRCGILTRGEAGRVPGSRWTNRKTKRATISSVGKTPSSRLTRY